MKAGLNMGLDGKTAVDLSNGTCEEQSKYQTKKVICVSGIVATVVVLVIVAVVTGFVVTMKEHNKTTRQIIEETVKLPSGGELHDRREFLPEENVEIDTITSPDGSQQVVIFDYNRKIQVLQGEHRCVITPFNGTSQDAVEGAPHMFVVDADPVKDASFLAPSARDMCKNKLVFWAHPRCMSTQDHPDRQKRDVFLRKNGGYFGHHELRSAAPPCLPGDVSCCAWCPEGLYNRITDTTIGGTMYGISSNGNYKIVSFNLLYHYTSSISRVWCGWILSEGYVFQVSPVYTCPDPRYQDPVDIGRVG